MRRTRNRRISGRAECLLEDRFVYSGAVANARVLTLFLPFRAFFCAVSCRVFAGLCLLFAPFWPFFLSFLSSFSLGGPPPPAPRAPPGGRAGAGPKAPTADFLLRHTWMDLRRARREDGEAGQVGKIVAGRRAVFFPASGISGVGGAPDGAVGAAPGPRGGPASGARCPEKLEKVRVSRRHSVIAMAFLGQDRFSCKSLFCNALGHRAPLVSPGAARPIRDRGRANGLPFPTECAILQKDGGCIMWCGWCGRRAPRGVATAPGGVAFAKREEGISVAKSGKGFERRQKRFRDSQRVESFAKVGKTAAAIGTAATIGGAVAQEASASLVYSFRDLMDTYSRQPVKNHDSSYEIIGPVTLYGHEITHQNFELGGFTEVPGGVIVTAYLVNNRFPGYPEAWRGEYDVAGIGLGNRPDLWMGVQKNAMFNGKPYIGDLTDGELVIAPENKVWLDMEVDGVLNNYSAMPMATGSGTVRIDVPINLVPEPVSGGLLGAGIVAVAVAKKGKTILRGLLERLTGRT